MELTENQWKELKKALEEIKFGTIEIKAHDNNCVSLKIIETRILGERREPINKI